MKTLQKPYLVKGRYVSGKYVTLGACQNLYYIMFGKGASCSRLTSRGHWQRLSVDHKVILESPKDLGTKSV